MEFSKHNWATIRRVITVASISILIFCHFAVYREARSQILKIATQQIDLHRSQRSVFKGKESPEHYNNGYWSSFSFVCASNNYSTSFEVADRSTLLEVCFALCLYSFKSLVLCNSVCNPLIYCTKNKDFRQAFKRILARQNQVKTQRKNHFDQIFKRNKTNQWNN